MAEARQSPVFDESVLVTFGDLDFSIYSTMLRNWSSLIDLRIADVAKMAGVSNASVVRFCKKCGYSGFPELKMAFVRKLQQEPADSLLPDVADDLGVFLSDEEREQFGRQIGSAFELIRWARGVLFVGLGSSGGLATYGASLFSSSGLLSLPVTSFPSYLTSSPHEDGAAIVITHSGVTPMVLAAVQELVRAGYEIVSITANPSGPIARLSDVCIGYRSPAHRRDAGIDYATRIPVVYVIEQLSRMLYNERIS